MYSSRISNAYFQEAQENFCAAEILFDYLKNKSRNATKPYALRGSSLFMLLQMAMEKLCKAAYVKQTGDKKLAPFDHQLEVLMTIAMRNPSLKDFFEKSHPETYDFLMKELNPLQPSNAGRNSENLEYPWISERNKVKFPAADLKLIHKYLHDPHNRNLMIIMDGLKTFLLSFNKIMRTS